MTLSPLSPFRAPYPGRWLRRDMDAEAVHIYLTEVSQLFLNALPSSEDGIPVRWTRIGRMRVRLETAVSVRELLEIGGCNLVGE